MERHWAEEQLRAERKKNIRLGITERLDVTMARVRALHNQMRLQPLLADYNVRWGWGWHWICASAGCSSHPHLFCHLLHLRPTPLTFARTFTPNFACTIPLTFARISTLTCCSSSSSSPPQGTLPCHATGRAHRLLNFGSKFWKHMQACSASDALQYLVSQDAEQSMQALHELEACRCLRAS